MFSCLSQRERWQRNLAFRMVLLRDKQVTCSVTNTYSQRVIVAFVNETLALTSARLLNNFGGHI